MLVKIHKEDAHGNIYTLKEPLFVDLGSGEPVRVPAGFRSDGASVPRFFWRYVFPPGDSRALRAAFVHDYLYRVPVPGWDRIAADRIFLALLVADGMPIRAAVTAYTGVRLFGTKSWRTYNV